ncbi:polysaccharide pyruvyl transferase family protein [Arvimicrobium flavum]|uniref:polysaccharide pyruvyl transferase family protein n=1 Tax=Arvimicrobium flavum TaxID=3393320 RepID=UPI00237C1B8A|nr:polysaccharide pyruvyl transferase family protein [Mesorhizobium shangrilense]
MRYGLIVFPRSENTGDAVQSLAALQFLPHLDALLDRETLHDVRSPDLIRAIGNGWYAHNVDNWPPAPNIEMLPISMHFSPRALESYADPEKGSYLRSLAPIGARDAFTRRALMARDVDAFMSGCLTLTLMRPSDLASEGNIVVCDVPDTVRLQVEARARRQVITVTHDEPDDVGIEGKLHRARRALRAYGSAQCVITSRLHAALPALAFGTPVLLVETAEDAYRFDGLRELVRHTTEDQFLDDRSIFDVNDPEPNGDTFRPVRERLAERVLDFTITPPLCRLKREILAAFRDDDRAAFRRLISSVRSRKEAPMYFGTTKNGEAGLSWRAVAPDGGADTRFIEEVASLQVRNDVLIHRNNTLTQELVAERERVGQFLADHARFQIVEEHLRKQIAEAASDAEELNRLRKALVEADGRVSSRDLDIENRAKAIIAHVEAERVLKAEIARLQRRLADSRVANAVAEVRNRAVADENAELKNQVSSLGGDKKRLEDAAAEAARRLEALAALELTAREERDQVSAEHAALLARGEVTELQAAEAETRLQTAFDQIQHLEQQLANLEMDRTKLEERLKTSTGSELVAKRLGTRLAAAEAENLTLRDNVWRRTNQAEELQLRLAETSAQNLALDGHASALQAKLDAMPWRVIAAYWRIRRFIPKRLLSGVGQILGKSREQWQAP